MEKSPDLSGPPRRHISAVRRDTGRGGSKIVSSCSLAFCFLVLVAVAIVVVFVLFRPRSPTIQVSAVQIPGFSVGNGTVSFTYVQYAAVRNPNRAAFSHYDSSLQLIHAGNQVGFMYIPAGEIDGGRTKYMGAKFAVDSFPLAAAAAAAAGVADVEVESRMRVKGRVRVLRFFIHHVEAVAGCRVGVSAGDGSVVGVRC
ncbi:hypothetical protein HPP92_023538 [Vanilla planifolia]|uniref:Late embryogenesis abundant protein LEA-2 subgroup domain-containing protein n=1 Tax=Vanilla planifolia TaxID=51239 RepID=A0A835PKS8_VANPL|nr:hypothetical protein HPP92_023538 [Vanilla planifolia]